MKMLPAILLLVATCGSSLAAPTIEPIDLWPEIRPSNATETLPTPLKIELKIQPCPRAYKCFNAGEEIECCKLYPGCCTATVYEAASSSEEQLASASEVTLQKEEEEGEETKSKNGNFRKLNFWEDVLAGLGVVAVLGR